MRAKDVVESEGPEVRTRKRWYPLIGTYVDPSGWPAASRNPEGDLSIQRALLIIADIGGYTRFMTLRRMSLAHAQGIVAHLLEAVIDASQGLTLIEVEGDAAFFYAPHSQDQEALIAGRAVEKAVAMHRAFHTRQREIVTLNRCGCDGCAAMNNLKIKFVAHVGEVATQKVKWLSKLAGVDVIVVHRMLKNLVPVPEYLLMSEPVFRHAA